MSFFFIIWLFILFAVFSFLGTRGFFYRIRRGHRPLAVRVVCGLLALFLLGSMLHGLRAQIRQAYDVDNSDELHLPLESVELTAEALAAGEFDLLVQLVAGTFQDQRFFPLEAREIRVSWPEGQGETLDVEMRPAGREVRVTIRPEELHDRMRHRNQEVPHMEVRFTHEISQRGGGSSSRIMPLQVPVQVFLRDRVPLFRHPYSLIPGWEANLAAVCVLTPILRDNPARTVPVEDFVAQHAGEIRDTLSRTQYGWDSFRARGFIALIHWTGPQFFLLVLAAVLGAQCFRQRGFGFTLCMTLLMVCLVSMDQHHRTHQQRRADDETLSASERGIARHLSGVSFFFREP